MPRLRIHHLVAGTLVFVSLTGATLVVQAGPPTPGGGSAYATPTPPVVETPGSVVLNRVYHDIALSQDGNDLYLTDYDGQAVEHYSVSTNGALSLTASWSNSGGFSGRPTSIAIGPGDTAHVAVRQDLGMVEDPAGLAAFAPGGWPGIVTHVSTLWSTHVWALSPRQFVSNTQMLSADYTAISPDGNFAYVTPYQMVRLIVYPRAANGDMTGQPPVQSLDLAPVTIDPRTIEISPDGAHMYIGYSAPYNLLGFSRDASTGKVTLIQTLQFDPTGWTNLSHIVISPDGRYLYAFSRLHEEPHTPTLKTYARDAASGLLTLVATTLRDSSLDTMAVTHNGRFLIVFSDNQLEVYRRNALSGSLNLVQNAAVGSGQGYGRLLVSADDTFLLVGRGDSILRLNLNVACPSQSVIVCP